MLPYVVVICFHCCGDVLVICFHCCGDVLVICCDSTRQSYGGILLQFFTLYGFRKQFDVHMLYLVKCLYKCIYICMFVKGNVTTAQ